MKGAIIACLFVAAPAWSGAGYAAEPPSEHTAPGAFVTDSVVTKNVMRALVEEKRISLIDVSVQSDADGRVLLSGSAATLNAVELAVAIVRHVTGVTSVSNHIVIAPPK